MNCSCPKCSSKVELDVPVVPDEGTMAKCSSCKAKFPVRRESFSGRALWQPSEISCAECGCDLGTSTFCPECKTLFPDYLVTQPPKATREVQSFFDRFAFAGASKPAIAAPTYARRDTSGKKFSAKNPAIAILALIGILAAVFGGWTYYRHYQAERQYIKNFGLAVYGAKAGTDMTLKICDKASAEWASKAATGERFNPHISADEDTRINNVKTETDKIMLKLANPPKKFVGANAKLAALYGTMNNAVSLATAPPASLATFTESSRKIAADFASQAASLKADLPPQLAEELRTAALKYKALRDF